jgi:peptidoglycan hydrolase-like protein with peptidoglycan-binding domain
MSKAAGPAQRRRRRWLRRSAITVIVLSTGAAGGWYAYEQGWIEQVADRLDGEAVAAAPRPTLPPATTTVRRQTLVQVTDVEGTLGYGDEHQLKAAAQGVVTRMPDEGATITRGKALYWLDNEPVVLLYGSVPFYRPLADGVDGGPDVEQLEENLAALGYDGFTVDDEFTGATAGAVEEWQADLGLAETGRVEPGQVVFLPEPIRTSAHKAQVGDRTGGGPLYSYTGTVRVVSVDLDVDDRELVEEGLAVTIGLPDESELKGTISTIGTVARTSPGGQDSEESVSTVDLTITLDDPKATKGFDKAPVDVEIVGDRREDVLTVPVSALLALREGGYGLEVVDGRSSRIVTVDVGMFADGRVEVTGPDLREGVRVGVPKS